jgi:hypothetical protein
MTLKLPAALLAATAIICGSAFAQSTAPPEPGAAATPGESNPARSDPTTATPSTVERPASGAHDESQSSDPDVSAAANRKPKMEREAKLSGVTAGSIVQNPAGQPIGRVKDIVPDTNTGAPAYVVISSRSGNTVVPYAVLSPMVQNGHVVLDRSKLESAPRVSESQLRENGDVDWKKQADRYWSSRNPPNLR